MYREEATTVAAHLLLYTAVPSRDYRESVMRTGHNWYRFRAWTDGGDNETLKVFDLTISQNIFVRRSSKSYQSICAVQTLWWVFIAANWKAHNRMYIWLRHFGMMRDTAWKESPRYNITDRNRPTDHCPCRYAWLIAVWSLQNYA